MTTTDTEALADVIVAAVRAATAPILARCAALETRCSTLETRAPSPEYQGVYKAGTSYARGSLVTRNGGLWLALADTTLIPGSNPTAWRLVCKEGQAR